MSDSPRYNGGTAPASDWKQYEAGSHNFLTDEGVPHIAARMIVMLADGDLTTCRNENGINRPLTGLPAGFEHRGRTTAVTSTVPFIAYW
jgi:hypothetical protein